jgi:Sulfatase-modifying factor enzyme 1
VPMKNPVEVSRALRGESARRMDVVNHRWRMCGALLAFSSFGIACDRSTNSSPPIPPPTEAEFYDAVGVPAGKFAIGFANGTLRSSRDVAAFSILRRPVTLRQFRACVAAGACQPPREDACLVSAPGEIDRPNYASGSDQTPVTCVEPDGTAAYCAWISAALPTLEQWTVAARGSAIHRFAWGDTPPTCDQHPRGTRPASGDDGSRTVSCEPVSNGFDVGTHPQGVSSSGMQDVLLTQSELLRGTADAPYLACRSDHCAVYGLVPGAIDSVHTVGRAADGALAPSTTVYSFRCAWNEEVKKP